MSAPLQGRRILLTRATEQADGLALALTTLGALVEVLPTIRCIASLAPGVGARFADADWWVFTSANGVRALDAWPGTPRLAAVGHATSLALQAASGRAVLEATAPFDAASLARTLLAAGACAGEQVFWPHGNLAGPELAAILSAAGLIVHGVEAYRTEPAPFDGAELAARLAAGAIDWVTFASGSAFHGLLAGLPNPMALAHTRLASIGPRTSAVIAAAGYAVGAQAQQATVEDMAAAIVAGHR